MITIKHPGEELLTEIAIGDHILMDEALPRLLLKLARRFVIITDSHVETLFGKNFEDHLKKKGFDVITLIIPVGEQHKTRETKQSLEDQMLAHKLGRECCVIALGGGVVTDVAGFVAATYCRGVPLVNIPTTLLGMVDASIGGKTGVNTPHGKNLIGAYHPARHIAMDLSTLTTLPEKELRNGAAEIIKYGLIRSKSLFKAMDDQFSQWESLDPNFFAEIIKESCKIKKEVVESDFKEKTGLRRILNFGHTIGHAIEKLENYRLSHGEAIAIGIAVESIISMKLGHLSAQELEKILSILEKYRFTLKLPSSATPEKIIEAMSMDKKAAGTVPRFVLIKSIGEVLPFDGEYCTKVSESIIKEALGAL